MKRSGAMVGPKPTKACVSGPPPCRRCRHTRTACVFKPRANASAMHELMEMQQDQAFASLSVIPDHQSILNRLARIEAALGITEEPQDPEDQLSMSREASLEEDTEVVPLHGVWTALAHLRLITRPSPDDSIWSRSVVQQLWSSFLKSLPLLHFLTDHSAFASPTPVLLASVLYISALHHPSARLASLDSEYCATMYSAIAELVTPCLRASYLQVSEHKDEEQKLSPQSKREKAFHDILGLIMASLSCEAYVGATGSWIAMAYRIWLDNCPAEMNSTTKDWRGLFSGLQVIDIEHASMHMSYPLLPRHAANPNIQRLDSHQGNAFQDLAEMMHFGLSHFVGRGLPSIWSSLNADEVDIVPIARSPFTENDSQVIRHWARKLDDWLVRYNNSSQPTPSDRQGILILLQYHLHKLYVLSIYHPARGFDLSPANISSFERHELLVSARAVLRLRQDDSSIWSNWDLVMITWAAVLLLQGVEDGMTHPDDLHLIQAHLQSLERRNHSAASIHTFLSHRLESSMQAMHTPPDTSVALAFPLPSADDSWTIFDQEIMSLANPPWLFDESTQLPQIQKASTMHQLQSGIQPFQYDSAISASASQHFAPNTQ
ncbi:transcriptional regulator family: Fungal Specific TF [Penicillium psychrosexuale]|uniref:transcriptional regulator family: Fungal Specific TF n=1 Tax=Penicillium psychrosexuale TaxID=1002107 RepID=UPI002545343A|nr:transcriptional regulator family: Fungal Specific TF [Penicillium psychrosexuale]KAJ5791573.1 transcriptional regulator family: Fungal Specific TF [Penicillium psychrosexuale]